MFQNIFPMSSDHFNIVHNFFDELDELLSIVCIGYELLFVILACMFLITMD